MSRHTGEGRLTLEEFESRVDEAWRATTHRELQHVMRELPVAPTPKPRGYAREQIRRAAFWLLVMVVAVVVIGAGALWWLIPLAWFKFGAIGHHRHARRFEPRQLATRSDDLTHV